MAEQHGTTDAGALLVLFDIDGTLLQGGATEHARAVIEAISVSVRPAGSTGRFSPALTPQTSVIASITARACSVAPP